ncbi:MAG: M23 family metallopeptidase [Myxococcota bacterium]
MKAKLAQAVLGAAVLVSAGVTEAQRFSPPGVLAPRSGRGVSDPRIWAPSIRFPIRDTPAFANSQVYGIGGGESPRPGGQCDAQNYSFPWFDNYCETRRHGMPLCPSGRGHQGQDIRAATCRGGVHPAVAAVDGTITNVGRFSVYLTGSDGTRYDYLHMSGVRVRRGQRVRCGDILGMVDDTFFDRSGRPVPTTVHLHFNIRQAVRGVGSVFVPVYTSLVAAYERLEGGDACGATSPVMDSGAPTPTPTGPRACWSPTLGQRVENGVCVQVDRPACGLDRCGTYECRDGSWVCSTECASTVAAPSCESTAPPTSLRPSPRPERGCHSTTLGRTVENGECVQTNGRARPGEPAACASGCGTYRCDSGRWVCSADTASCSTVNENPACGAGGAECRSATLGRNVPSGSCVQVNRDGCGESSCAWYRCGDGAWGCSTLDSCEDEVYGNAACGESECSGATDCDTCAVAEGCGWCDGSCRPVSARSSCAEWTDDRNECRACDATDCATCAESGFCAWCPGSGCINASDDEEVAACGTEPIQSRRRCE